MIIINKSGVLKYKNLKFKCALGKAGVGKKRKEGDNITCIANRGVSREGSIIFMRFVWYKVSN